MASIVTRSSGATAKGSALTHSELDNNLININTELVAATAGLSTATTYLGDTDNNVSKALHSSPNAITAMFIYDTSKDSDGGAWTQRCQNTSWYNESLSGAWLGAQDSEFQARYAGATVSATELVTNGDFSSGTTGWVVGAGWTISDGIATHTGDTAEYLRQTILSVGATYKVTFTVVSASSPSALIGVYLGGAAIQNFVGLQPGKTYSVYGVASNTSFSLRGFTGVGVSVSIDNISVREITALNTKSNDYFQLSTDGKFYRLWKNGFLYSQDFTNAYWNYSNAVTITANVTTAPDGTSTGNLVVPNAGTVNARTGRNNAGTAGVNRTYSFYVKTNGIQYITVNTSNTLSYGTCFDIVNGTKIGPTSGIVGTPSITNVGNGWWRITHTTATGSIPTIIAGTTFVRKGTSETDTFNGTDGFYIWGAQWEDTVTFATAYERKVAEGSISEVFRGNKRDFPRLAGIVAEAGSVTIYDLTEAGRPMWMRFAGLNNQCVVRGNNASSVAIHNGMLHIGHGSSFGLARVIFPRDSATLINTTGEFLPRPVSARNDTAFSYYLATGTTQGLSIGNATVNAVAMTVLPDAPLDPFTGLTVPTIAVATAGGLSIVKHNGTVVNSGSATGVGAVQLRQEYVAWIASGDTILRYATAPGALGSGFGQTNISTIPDFGRGNSSGVQVIGQREFLRRSATAALVQKLKNHEATASRGIAATITNLFNTGHQPGDIRRTYLSDNVVESVSGPELVTNGTFDGGTTTGWTADANAGGVPVATLSVVNGRLRVACGVGGGRAGFATQSFATIPGKTYQYRATGYTGTSTFSLRVGSTIRGFDYVDASPATGVPYSSIFTATTTTAYLSLVEGSIVEGQYAEFDNISVKEVVADRSYKAQGASITGTLTKSAVASAAELVAYSGFSATDYLQEPYSADLDFGTGEWSVGAWVNVPTALTTTYSANFPAGIELLSNAGGPFTSTTGWSSNGGIALSGNDIQITAYGSGFCYAEISLSTQAYKSYQLTLTGRRGTAANGLVLGTESAYIFSPSITSTTDSTITVYLSPTSATTKLRVMFNATGAGETVYFSLASAKLLDSAKVAKRAYSSGASIELGVTMGGYLTATAYDGTTTRTVTTTAAYNTATWAKAEACYTTDGTLAIRVNGVEVAATRGNPLLTLNNSNAVLTIGNSYALDAPFPGSIALLKLSATVPTAEQSQWMYEQEKQMFRDGAQICLPDSSGIADLTYDDMTDKYLVISASNKSDWTGLVRTSVTTVPAGSYIKALASSGIQLLARSSINPGVDFIKITPTLQNSFNRRNEISNKLQPTVVFDFVGGFTASTTNGNTAITSISGLSVPYSSLGAVISGSGIPSNAILNSISSTTGYISAAATATASNVQISFLDFILPPGYTARSVIVAGSEKQEGSTKDWTRRFDGFKETIRFAVAPGYLAWVQIKTIKEV